MTTFTNITFDEFMRSASEFFRATSDFENVTTGQAENGCKTLILLLFGHDSNWTVDQKKEALMILDLSTARCMNIANHSRMEKCYEN